MSGDSPLLEVDGLRVGFRTRRDAVRGVSFSLRAGECLAIVGESGAGKSVTARALVGLAGPGSTVRAERMCLDGQDLTGLSDRAWQDLRGRRIGLVLPDALGSLDPVRRVGSEIAEALRNHRVVKDKDVRQRVVALLSQARVPEPELRARQYPHQLSGGLRQRALIASAMAASPAVLVADEPTTALDVTVQAQILDLLAATKAAGTAILLISHDLSVVARLADRIAVMYDGVFLEEGTTAELLASPIHPYTKRLLAAVPAAHQKGTRLAERAVPSSPTADGCSYAAHCPLVTDQCRSQEPPRVGGQHGVWCWQTDADWADRAPRVARVRTTGRDVILEVDGVTKSFGRVAVEDVSFTLRAGETLGVVGESGAGKSTLAQLVMGLLEPDSGSVRLLGQPWSNRSEAARRPLRHRVQLVNQDPLSSFDPRYPVERLVGEALGATGRRSQRRQRDRIVELLHLVGLDAALLDCRPRQLSSGQSQRIAIARALATCPDVIVCDEPVSALDVSIQAQILDLFSDVQDAVGVSLLFISHDLGVVYHCSDRVLVMRNGRVVETGPVDEVFQRPCHDHTKSLLAALPMPLPDPTAPAHRGAQRP